MEGLVKKMKKVMKYVYKIQDAGEEDILAGNPEFFHCEMAGAWEK